MYFLASNFVQYVNSTTNFSVSGTVAVRQSNGMTPSQHVSWDLAGIDPACTGGEAGNRCGIHIHKGKSCSEDALGHLFKVAQDPWVTGSNGTDGVYYVAVNPIYSSSPPSGVEVITNLTASDILGRAVVIHDSTPPGRRIACAVLIAGTPPATTTTTTTKTWSKQFWATHFVKYVNSTTNFSVGGDVQVMQMGSTLGEVPTQLLTWDLTGIDPACSAYNSGPRGAGNVCGIHIHEGRSCSEDALGHLFNVAQDPWVAGSNGTINGTIVWESGVYYHQNYDGMNTSVGSAEVWTNLTASEILGRAVIVHDSTPPGRRIACALLTDVNPSHTSTTTSSPTFLSGSLAVHASVLVALVVVAIKV